MTTETASPETESLFERVTKGIIADLEGGIAPWTRPWRATRGHSCLPINAATKRPYSGINIILLWLASLDKGYTSRVWLTYKQAQEMGGNVRKGERSTVVIYAARYIPKEEKQKARMDPTYQPTQRGMYKTYLVFNTEQCDGLPADLDVQGYELPEAELHEIAEQFIAETKATIRIGGDRAYYSPDLDYIAIPRHEAYDPNQINWYRTAFHELGHWAGHPSRLDRPGITGGYSMSSPEYAFEELVAELTAAFLCGYHGIQPTVRHADYIGAWAKIIKDRPQAIFSAASKASAAANYLIGLQPNSVELGDDDEVEGKADLAKAA